MKHFIAPCLMLCSLFAMAQGRVQDTKDLNMQAGSLFYSVGGFPVVTNEYYNLVEGSPFFKEEWLNGNVILKTNATVKKLRVKLNLIKGTVHYLDQFGAEFIAGTSLKEIVLQDSVLNQSYRFIHTSNFLPQQALKAQTWLLCLAAGKASGYKKFDKTVIEQKRYGSATLEQRIQTTERYAVYVNDTLQMIKKLKELPELFGAHKKQVSEFMDSKKIAAFSADEQFIATIEYYNSLLQ